ncbi:SGNH/GDSL hydrolase family protein [Paenibacillus cymbidii]|uniref:SGNH/GDSL hydrolase family protein n=1 Tax=Paenibacillus cymbidii TaxID=1639034 RepID=UPI0014368383|nr:SGNH/GDSL hydrolase family protein [Paenibacillus cymbidii]
MSGHLPSEGGAAASRPLRIAFVGDSVTWVDGMLLDGFVGKADEYVRSTFAETVTCESMRRFGRGTVVESRKLFGGKALKLQGAGSGAAFELTGDELTLVLAKERSNRSAACVDLYADGVLIDTFSCWNEEPCGTDTVRFAGDGQTAAFDLGRAFTYEHQVDLDGRRLQGELLTAGYGAGFPQRQEYAVIRKYGTAAAGSRPKVHHFLWFPAPPEPGAVIEATFRYGETIAYAKGTVGEIAEAIDSPLESRYGAEQTGESAAAVGPISFGLDFRETDERAAVTWRFPHAAKRSFELLVRSFDPRGDAVGEPTAIVNFATNRFHAVMNAGIGGKSASWFNGDDPLRSIASVLAWKPDLLFVGLGTNDDWEEGNTFAAWRRIEGLAEAEVRNGTLLNWRSCKQTGPGVYSVETAELIIFAIAERSVTIDGTNTVFDGIRAGDIVVIGHYSGDNRNVQCRILRTWDQATRTGTFAEPLEPNPVTPVLGDYVGQAVRIKRLEGFTEQMSRLLRTVRQQAPHCRLALLETGLSNYGTRLLMGYPEQIRHLAAIYGAEHVPIYRPLMEWQYSQTPDIPVVAVAEDAHAGKGAIAGYRLLDANGRDINEGRGMQLRRWSVRVNGEERYGRGCAIEGGFTLAFRPGTEGDGLQLTEWAGRRCPEAAYRFLPARLVFNDHLPAPDATIEVTAASAKWSSDDTHLDQPDGIAVYAGQVNRAMARMRTDLRL